MKRRTFLQTLPPLAAAARCPAVWTQETGAVSPANLPRWRGFNLLEKFTLQRNAPYVERDFEWAASWGFDFFRLPTDYRCWTDPEDPYALDEAVLAHIDQTIAWGKEYGIHINLNLHRGPGYCVNPPEEPLNLWEDEEALEQFCYQWEQFAKRYQDVPADRLSFDLLNEPPNIEEESYAGVMRAAVETIHGVDPKRLVVVDGLRWGRQPVHSLADLPIAQSTRGYDPMAISHYKASWVNSENFPKPDWPLQWGDTLWNQAQLRDNNIKPFQELEAKGVGVHVGEWGCYNKTPHDIALTWMEDFLQLWQSAGWGWALWNLRGSFGVVDSGREDVQYEDFQGHQLDRKMLELIRAY